MSTVVSLSSLWLADALVMSTALRVRRDGSTGADDEVQAIGGMQMKLGSLTLDPRLALSRLSLLHGAGAPKPESRLGKEVGSLLVS